VDIKNFCTANKTMVLNFPHTIHIIPPLDVGIFNVYKAAYRGRSAKVAVQWNRAIKDFRGAKTSQPVFSSKSPQHANVVISFLYNRLCALVLMNGM
jgi:hypothetical protein